MKAEAKSLPTHAAPDLGAWLAKQRIRLAGRLQLGLHSEVTRYGLRRDLTLPLEHPKAKIPISVRELAEADLDSLLSVEDAQGNAEESLEITRRRAFVEKGIERCFVAVDERDGKACYMQWLIDAPDVEPIRHSGNFPSLAPGEALLENAYTPVKYRGLGIMSAAMAMIAERASDIGARYVLTFVDDRNIPSLKGCQRSGFYPHLLHRQVQKAFGLIKRNSFETLAENDPRRNLKF